MSKLKAPFPWFGGKSRVADIVWQRFGAVRNYVEPFFGSGSVLLGRPTPFDGVETVNDKDGFVANFWRAVAAEPDVVAGYADWPVNENDLHARHVWLVCEQDSLRTRLEGDPDFYDAKIAGWWVWGICCWIGGGFCSGRGPWRVVDGQLVNVGGSGSGVSRRLAHVGDAGRGVHRKLAHVGDAGMGVHRKLAHVGDAGMGDLGVYAWFDALSARLRRVRVCSGDWTRVMGESVTVKHGLTAVFLDPPYASDNAIEYVGGGDVAHAVREWAIANGDNPKLRIALCGYSGEHDMPEAWAEVKWKARGGYGSQGSGLGRENAHRERVWFSPHCLNPTQQKAPLFQATA